jgi:hypothetical protein
MPIDLLSSIKKTSQWTFSSPTLNGVLGSSFFVSIVIALLMVLLIMIMYPAKKNTPISILLKMFIYMFFGTMLVVFLHDGVIKTMYDEEQQCSEEETLMSGVNIKNADVVYNTNPIPTIQMPNTQSTPNTQNTPSTQNTQQEKMELPLFIGGGGSLDAAKPPKHKPNPYKHDAEILL